MVRRAFVIVADWPFDELTTVGRLTWCCTGGTESHIGIFIPCCTAEEIATHSNRWQPSLSHTSAHGAEHVAFDYMSDLRPRFQSWENDKYYTKRASVWLYPILDVDASDVHAACVEVARLRPRNDCMHRMNAIVWCWPFRCWPSNTARVGPSTCVALTLRIISRARGSASAALTNDKVVFDALDLERCGLSAPCAPCRLTGHTPRSGLEAMQAAGMVGRPVDGFEAAIAQCQGPNPAGPAGASVGNFLPTLTLLSRD